MYRFLYEYIFISLEKMPSVIVGPYGNIVCLASKETAKVIFRMTVPFYISTSSDEKSGSLCPGQCVSSALFFTSAILRGVQCYLAAV